jgi:DNA helicase HerA-like ATPase
MTDADAAADRVAAAERALAEAQAALAAAKAESAGPPADSSQRPRVSEHPTEPEASRNPPSDPSPAGPLAPAHVDAIRAGYAFDAPSLEMGALVNGDALADVPIRIPIAMTNRHGLVAGATGTGKTKTLQVLAEQLSAAGVPVFAADVKGDLSGIAVPGTPSDALLARTRGIGQDWRPSASPTEFFTLGGVGRGIPVRASVRGFGSLLLSKVLGLNATQESSLGLVFHYAEQEKLPLVDLADLRAVLMHLTSDAGKGDLDGLGGLSKATAGVILRELVGFSDQGADAFFGEPAIDVQQFLRTASDGRGLVSLLEVPGVVDQPALFSTFLMWLLTELYDALPEVGDLDKPKLVFFFDEAHLLFRDASKDFLAVVTQTVRLIRSKGVGIFFVTQTPKDVPGDVLAQLGSRVQHQLRAHTPDDARALKATVSTYPTSGYDLAEVLQSLATGEAIVTVMNEKGAPSPVAWTRLRAPVGSMSPAPDETVAAVVAASPLLARFGTPTDPPSARDLLEERTRAEEEAAARALPSSGATSDSRTGSTSAAAARMAREMARAQRAAEQAAARRARAAEAAAARAERERERRNQKLRTETVNAGVKIARSVIGAIFGRR